MCNGPQRCIAIFPRSGFHGYSLPVHDLQGLRDHVPCVDSAALHTQQQTAGKDVEPSLCGIPLGIYQEMENSFVLETDGAKKTLKEGRVI